jgi:glycosyltransferase involved in cell wall biosynthesis
MNTPAPPQSATPGRHKGRVVLVIGSLALGGAEGQLAMLAEQLVLRGWSVAVFPLDKSGPLVGRLESAGIVVIDGGRRLKPGSKAARMLLVGLYELRLIRHLVRSRPDVVHAFLPLTNFLAAVAGRLTFIRLVVTSKRGLGFHQDRHPWVRWIDRVANALSHVITGNSRAVAEDTARRDGYPAERIRVIPNGLDFSRFGNIDTLRTESRRRLGLAELDIGIVKIANLIPYKGHIELVEAFGQLSRMDARLRLFLVGKDQGLAADLLELARRLGIVERIQMMGQRSDVPELLAAMDLGVMASHEEGSSNALLEKLAAGLPVVATDVGGNPEALDGMPDCYLVRSRDPDDLARGMRSAIENLPASFPRREVRRRLVRERHSVDAMVDAYERLYLAGMAGGTN